jgi:hypothetical protein
MNDHGNKEHKLDNANEKDGGTEIESGAECVLP